MLEVKATDIKKYEAAVLSSKEASQLLSKSLTNTSHCLILQSEDSLLLDVLAFIYIRTKLEGKGGTAGEISARIMSNSIPDVLLLPSGDKVLTEDVERVVETAFLTPTEFDYKFYVIDKCETMNEAAQNKLLKLLEEPPPMCRFILKCTSKYALLPTVRSRSEIVEIQPLSLEAVLATLPLDIETRQRSLIAATCFGRLDYAERVQSDNKYVLIEDACFEVFFELKRSSDLLKSAYVLLEYKDYIDTVIFYIECILHDCMVSSIGEKERIYFKHREGEIRQLSKEYVAEVVLALTEKIKHARLRVSGYGNVTSIIDELLFSMLEVKAKWQKL